jgi:hypothetical protein
MITLKKDNGIRVGTKDLKDNLDDGFNSIRMYVKSNIQQDECESYNTYFFGSFQSTKNAEDLYSLLNYNHNIDFSYSNFLINAEHFALNPVGEFVPFNMFVKYSTRYYGKYGKEGRVFLRPNSGYKTLPSGLVDIEKDLPNLIRYQKANCKNNELIYVSPPKDIKLECRFFIFNNETVAYSTYLINGECITMENVPPECIKFVDKYLKFHKEKENGAYVLDVALTDSGFELIETNGYFTSALYACNPEKIVQPLIQQINGI